jgi:hypothetical protein
MASVFRHHRRDPRYVYHLMPLRLGILAQQERPALPTLLGPDLNDLIHFALGLQLAAVPRMPRLSA